MFAIDVFCRYRSWKEYPNEVFMVFIVLGQRLSVTWIICAAIWAIPRRSIRSLRSIQLYHARCWHFLDSRIIKSYTYIYITCIHIFGAGAHWPAAPFQTFFDSVESPLTFDLAGLVSKQIVYININIEIIVLVVTVVAITVLIACLPAFDDGDAW